MTATNGQDTTTGPSYRQLDHWARVGYLDCPEPTPGTGRHRVWPAGELQVAHTMARLAAAGIAPASGARTARDNGCEIAPGVRVLVDVDPTQAEQSVVEMRRQLAEAQARVADLTRQVADAEARAKALRTEVAKAHAAARPAAAATGPDPVTAWATVLRGATTPEARHRCARAVRAVHRLPADAPPAAVYDARRVDRRTRNQVAAAYLTAHRALEGSKVSQS